MEWINRLINKVFHGEWTEKDGVKKWEGTISSDCPSVQGPVHVYKWEDWMGPEWDRGWQAGFDDVMKGTITIDQIHFEIKDGKKVRTGQLSGIRATAKERDK